MGTNQLENNQKVLFSFIDLMLNLREMNYRDLAIESEIPYQTIHNLKHGYVRISFERLHTILEALGTNYTDYIAYVTFLHESGLHSAIALNED